MEKILIEIVFSFFTCLGNIDSFKTFDFVLLFSALHFIAIDNE